MCEEKENIAQTIEKMYRKPFVLKKTGNSKTIAVPTQEGWDIQEPAFPSHKVASPGFADIESFIAYVNRHLNLAETTIWANVQYSDRQGEYPMSFTMTAILNDHGPAECHPSFKDHTAHFRPQFSHEFLAWMRRDGKPMSQADFARFLEDQQTDIVSEEGYPSSAEMMQMAQNFSAKQEMLFSKSINQSNGSVEMVLTQKEDGVTTEKMRVFERFCIGIPVFYRGDAFKIYARLRYRHPEGKLVFWYDLVRPDLAFESAVQNTIDKVKGALPDTPIFLGEP